MDQLKKQLELQLIGNAIKDKCLSSDKVIFAESWCSQERVIRFTLPALRNAGDYCDNKQGRWKTGDVIMLEASNAPGSFIVNCVLDVSSAKRNVVHMIRRLLGVEIDTTVETAVIKTWDLTPADGKINTLLSNFDRFIDDDLSGFAAMFDAQEYTEGMRLRVELNKYERNLQAREACLRAHGTTCAVCGMNFARVYGPEFAGIIEVHHKVPISEIGEKYVVDPVKDLIPVCPNCHAALHSKKGGVYTVEELKSIIRENHNG